MKQPASGNGNKTIPEKLLRALLTASGFVFVFWPLLLPTTANAQVTEIYFFNGLSSGGYPGYQAPTLGRDGRLYGMNQEGGDRFGIIFRQSIDGTENLTLYDFTGQSDGGSPEGGLTLGSDGDFYGASTTGGSSQKGVLFKITPEGVLTVLHAFTGGEDGSYPIANPIDGNFYGTTNGQLDQNSTVYKYTLSSGVLTTIYTFDSQQAAWSPPLQGSDGNLYLVSAGGCLDLSGCVIEMTTEGVVKFVQPFDGEEGGGFPNGPLAEAADGNFYGTTEDSTTGSGVVFKIDGATHAYSVLYTFGLRKNDGIEPLTGLTQGTDGNLYGATGFGGKFGYGSLFRISTTGAYSQLYSFPQTRYDNTDSPWGWLLQDPGGVFYGLTDEAGVYSNGSIYKLDVGLGPFVSFVLSAGKVGSTAQILGQSLNGTTGVTFNGVAATSFTVVSDTYMTAVVPAGATTGPVVVTTPSGPLTSNKNFTVIQ